MDPAALVARLREAWRRSDSLFDLMEPEALLERPIPLRQPFIFYLGHFPAFAWNQACRGVLGRASFDPAKDELFERGIDPPDDQDYSAPEGKWPEPQAILEYRDRVREALVAGAGDAVERGRGDILQRVLEHEQMHHETLTYMMLRLPYASKRRPESVHYAFEGARPAPAIHVPGGTVRMGAKREEGRFGWDNEFPEHETRVGSLRVDALPVRNAEFLEFVQAGGYREPRLWSEEAWAWLRARGQERPAFWCGSDGDLQYRTLFDALPLPRVADWPAYVTWAEARAYARWRGRRLPTEPEYHRVAHGSPDGEMRAHPWGDSAPSGEHGNFGFRSWSPGPVGTHAAGQSAWGVQDLVGDGWEWTATPFAPFPGFEPMRGYEGYSADFFDGRHYVLLGASWATDADLVRRSFRNWFQPQYPHVFAKFRCVEDASA